MPDFFEFEKKEAPDNILLVHPYDVEIGISGKTGVNVRKGKDDTLYTTVTGVVKFEALGRDKTKVSCYPAE